MRILYKKGADLITQAFNGAQIGLFDVNKNELVGKGYNRQPFPELIYLTEDDNNFYYVNSNTIVFPVATADWSNIYYIGLILDNQLALLVSLPSPATVRTGQQLVFFAGMIEFQIPKQIS